MLENTDFCPFHKICETREDRIRIEKRLLKERREFFSESSYLDRVEYNAFMSDYERYFESIHRIQERCTSNHKRCLRFWQKTKRVNRDEIINQPTPDWITEITTT
jgi:hypothetical protein